MNRKVAALAVSVLFLGAIVLSLGACASLGVGTMTPKQQATVWLSMYNAEYDDTMAMATNGTPAQKDLAAKKKAVLVQIYPLLKIYVAVVDAGGTPTVADTAALTNLVNQLTALATPAK